MPARSSRTTKSRSSSRSRPRSRSRGLSRERARAGGRAAPTRRASRPIWSSTSRVTPKDFPLDQAKQKPPTGARASRIDGQVVDGSRRRRQRQVNDRRNRHGHLDPGPVPREPRLVGQGRRDTTRRSRGGGARRVGPSRLISRAARRWDPPTRRAASARRLRTTLAAREPAGWRARCARPTRRSRSPGSRARCRAG